MSLEMKSVFALWSQAQILGVLPSRSKSCLCGACILCREERVAFAEGLRQERLVHSLIAPETLRELGKAHSTRQRKSKVLAVYLQHSREYGSSCRSAAHSSLWHSCDEQRSSVMPRHVKRNTLLLLLSPLNM